MNLQTILEFPANKSSLVSRLNKLLKGGRKTRKRSNTKSNKTAAL